MGKGIAHGRLAVAAALAMAVGPSMARAQTAAPTPEDAGSLASPASSPGTSRTVHIELAKMHRHVRLQARTEDGTPVQLCNPPCNLDLPVGRYRFWLQADIRSPVPAEPFPLLLDRDATLRARYRSARGQRIGGWVAMVAGTAIGGFFLGAGIHDLRHRCSPTDVHCLDLGPVVTGLSSAFLAVTLTVGIVLVTWKDHAHVRLEPAG